MGRRGTAGPAAGLCSDLRGDGAAWGVARGLQAINGAYCGLCSDQLSQAMALGRVARVLLT
jgi:hypothetical protein